MNGRLTPPALRASSPLPYSRKRRGRREEGGTANGERHLTPLPPSPFLAHTPGEQGEGENG